VTEQQGGVGQSIHEAVAGGVDPAYAEMLARAEANPTPEADSGREFPRSDYFVGRLDEVRFRTAFEEQVPQCRIGYVVDEGPQGSVGVHYNADLTLTVSKMTRDGKDSPLRPRTPAETEEATQRLLNIGARLKFVFGLETALPRTPTEAGVKEWMATAAASKMPVVFGGYSLNGFATAVLMTSKRPEEPARKNKKPVVGKTAVEFAREELAKAATGGGGRRTLGGQASTTAPSSGY
jgi:hypothetical protein